MRNAHNFKRGFRRASLWMVSSIFENNDESTRSSIQSLHDRNKHEKYRCAFFLKKQRFAVLDRKIRFKINVRFDQFGRNVCNTGFSHGHVYSQTTHQHAHTRQQQSVAMETPHDIVRDVTVILTQRQLPSPAKTLSTSSKHRLSASGGPRVGGGGATTFPVVC